MGRYDDLLREQKTPVREDRQPLKERVYDKIPISLRALDVIIVLLIVAIIACIVIGALKGNNLL